ncbi:hypothetical protein KIPB_015516, partial [Kipferlia bialata]
PSLAFSQGPALTVGNNAPFELEDFQSLCSIENSRKAEDTASTGRFGVGFNSVYHLTDLPTLVTSDRE